MPENRFIIRTMRREELDVAVEWAAQEGWNPGLHDADCYYSADPNGFWLGELNGEIIATISALKYSPHFGFIGFYIVKPEYRGQGYGFKLWQAALNYLAGCNIGLDGVVAQQSNYAKSGFALAYRNIRYQGTGGGSVGEEAGIVELAAVPFTGVEAYEKPFFPAPRGEFLQAWLNQPESHALGIVQDGQLAGYGVMRPCRRGYKIGPLFADSPALAETLFSALRAKAGPDEALFLDVPQPNPAAVELAERQGMQVVFETARMYSKENPLLPLQRIFGVTSFEVG